mmetsp:Transcript_125358/g.351064  ORF Transcript_125358/g.351064 Transcript_125358/m.351064 type:complete len:173 (-) Transcript_125358:53-571(-)
MKVKRLKPQGELVWVMDGKTEYLGQLVEPLSMMKTEEEEDEEDVELEVQWTHNGKFEWVTLDRVRVESSGVGEGRRRTPRKPTPAPKASSPEKKKASPEKPKGSPKKRSTISSETKTGDPPSKKQKVRSGDKATGANGFFASLTSQVVGAKDAVVSGFQEVFKELMGSSSSS